MLVCFPVVLGVLVLLFAYATKSTRKDVGEMYPHPKTVPESEPFIGGNSDSPRASDQRAAAPRRSAVERPEQWQTIAKGTSLTLVNPGSLAVSEGVIQLLDLNPTEFKGLNEDLSQFVERVREAEKKKAYVLVGSDGSEQIVVPPFDRGPLIQQFREKVERELGKNVADFCAQQMLYDSALAVGNAEVRVYIEPGEQGRDMLVISRGVHRRNSSGNPKWEGEAAPPLVTKTIAGKDFGIRYRHLHYMAQKGLLPRKQEDVK